MVGSFCFWIWRSFRWRFLGLFTFLKLQEKNRHHYLEVLISLPQHSGRWGKLELFQPPPRAWTSVDGIYHAAAENIHRSDFVGESGTLSGCYFEVAGDAGPCIA